MESLSKEQQENIANLVKEKNFALLEFELEQILKQKDSSFLINLLGVSKISKKSPSKEDAIEAQKLFKRSYEKDKNFQDALLNYARVSMRLTDYPENIGNALKYLEEYNSKKYDPQALLFVSFNFELINSIASIVPIGAMILLSTFIFCKSFLSNNSSSLLVPDLVISIAG